MEQSKTCNGCKQILSLDLFSIRKSAKDGRRSRCKSCENSAAKNYQARNPEKVKETNKRYREANSEKRAKANRDWNEANLERRRAYRASYRENHPVDPVKRLAYKRIWMQNNSDKIRNSKHMRRARQFKNGSFIILRKELNKIDNSLCYNCGTNENITVDHIIPISRGGRHSIGNLMPLCKSCNSKKGARTIMEWRLSIPAPRYR